jgi:hypothetical protein
LPGVGAFHQEKLDLRANTVGGSMSGPNRLRKDSDF